MSKPAFHAQKMTRIYDCVMDAFGGVEGYVKKHLVPNLKASMEAGASPLAATKDRQVSLRAHTILVSMAKEIDRTTVEHERIDVDRQEVQGIMLNEVFDLLPQSPEIRQQLLEQILKSEPNLVLQKTANIIEVQQESISGVLPAPTADNQ